MGCPQHLNAVLCRPLPESQHPTNTVLSLNLNEHFVYISYREKAVGQLLLSSILVSTTDLFSHSTVDSRSQIHNEWTYAVNQKKIDLKPKNSFGSELHI